MKRRRYRKLFLDFPGLTHNNSIHGSVISLHGFQFCSPVCVKFVNYASAITLDSVHKHLGQKCKIHGIMLVLMATASLEHLVINSKLFKVITKLLNAPHRSLMFSGHFVFILKLLLAVRRLDFKAANNSSSFVFIQYDL